METDLLADTIARAQRGDAAAFDTLIDGYADRLYGYFYRTTGSRHDAEDLLQDLFIRLVRAIGAYQHEGRFEAWLFRMAANLARDRIRQISRSRRLGLASADNYSEALERQPAGGDPDPSAPMGRAEQVDQLQRALDGLPQAEREVVMLRHFSQLSFRQIAETMGTPIGTALARAHRGLARLREQLGGADAERSGGPGDRR
jgi:RNA polymerase sigma-70 factor, ECF subfamily